jgi:hypothetical protein
LSFNCFWLKNKWASAGQHVFKSGGDMFTKIFASLSLTCAFLAAANAKADTAIAESLQPNSFELAYMGYQGMFSEWGLPSDGAFCLDVNNRIMIAQDLAYAYLLHNGQVDALLRPSEGAPVAQVKGKDIPMQQGQTQSQGQVKAKDIPVSQGQTQSQGQAQVKAKDIPVSQGQTQSQGQAQVKAKDIPVSQGQTQSQGQAQVKAKDIPVSQGQTQSQGQAQVKAKDIPVSQSQSQAQVKAKDLPVSQSQAQIKAKGKMFPSQQHQTGSQAGVMLSDLNLRRFVDYTNALTADEVQLVRENFSEEFLDDLYLRMRDLCRE